MNSLGIDPGTMSFDFCLLNDRGDVLDETSIPSPDIMARPGLLVDVVMSRPADIVVGPSGYGVPTCALRDADEAILARLLPADEGETPVNEGIRASLRLLRDRGAPVVFTPGVIDLPTVPASRTFNRFDMGTADKVAVAFLALSARLEGSGRSPAEETFVLLEIGAGFTAALAVSAGRIVDGVGGSMSFGGLNSGGMVDGELAYRRGARPYHEVYRYGMAELDPRPVAVWEPDGEAGRELVERAAKAALSLAPVVGPGAPIVVSGRLAEMTWVGDAVLTALAPHAPAVLLRRRARQTKAAAEGSARLGLAFLGGPCAALAVHMGIVAAGWDPAR